jgi:hypothetical protein
VDEGAAGRTVVVGSGRIGEVELDDGDVATRHEADDAWEVYDECGMWRQVGAQPPPASINVVCQDA